MTAELDRIVRPTYVSPGGTFAIYSLLCRHAKITIFGLKHDSDKALSVFHHDPKRPKKKRSHFGKAVSKALEKSPVLQKMLLVFVLCGTCALVGDGVLTPAVEGELAALDSFWTLVALLLYSPLFWLWCLFDSSLV